MNRSLTVAAVVLSLSSPVIAGSQSGTAASSKLGIDIPEQEKEFAQRLHYSNENEVKLGLLAQRKAQSGPVKELAMMIAADHQKADEQLNQLAKSKGWKLNEPKPMNATERAVMEADEAEMKKLEKLEGRAFEQAYLAHMVVDHDMDITKAALAVGEFRGSELGSMVQQMLPTLQRHREHAYRALGALKSDPNQLGVGGSGRRVEPPSTHPGSQGGTGKY
jgi:putative membrane protein